MGRPSLIQSRVYIYIYISHKQTETHTPLCVCMHDIPPFGPRERKEETAILLYLGDLKLEIPLIRRPLVGRGESMLVKTSVPAADSCVSAPCLQAATRWRTPLQQPPQRKGKPAVEFPFFRPGPAEDQKQNPRSNRRPGISWARIAVVRTQRSPPNPHV